MVCRTSLRLTSAAAFALAFSLAVAARAEAPPGAAPVEPIGAPPSPAAGGEMPPPTATETPAPTPNAVETTPTVAGTLAASGQRAANVSYGMGLRLRWVSVPGWMLNLFTKKNVPLSSYSTAVEFFRRKGEFDFILSIGYQNMSPPDGNWLGKGHDPSIDTDYVQFKNVALVGFDLSFVWHTYINDWFGMHYGAGLGVGVVTGHMLRTSDGTGCTDQNAGDYTKCHPIGANCPPSGCTDASLAALGPGPDSSTTPQRFTDGNVPPALPIVNVLLGVDFRLPRVRGWEAKIEGGFYDAFFLGGGVGYTF
jgi:hypothetical protein